MNTMTTVTEVLSHLREKGYTTDFNLKENCLECHSNYLQIHPDEFVVDEHFRFEGPSDPADETIVYAISSAAHRIKGVLVNGYGIYSDEITDKMVKALSVSDGTTKQESGSGEGVSRTSTARQLDADMMEMDISLFRKQIKQEDSWKNGDKNSITLFKADAMRIVLIALHKGAELKTHTAPGVISVQVLEGKISFITARQSAELSEGQLLALHAGIPHSVFAQEESLFLLTIAVIKA